MSRSNRLATSRILRAAGLTTLVGFAVAVSFAPLTAAPTGALLAAMASSLCGGFAAALWTHHTTIRSLRGQRARMQSIIETVADGIAVTDGRGRIESFNAAAERMFGHLRADVIGKPLALLVKDGQAETVESFLVQGPRPTVGLGREVVGRRRDGTTFALEIAVSAMRFGTDPRFTAVFRDVTVRKHVQRALSEARDAALASTQARSALLANVSHEIRTPINIILGMTEMIADAGDLNRDQRDFLERTRHATRTLLSLLDDTLDLSKIEAGMMTLSIEDVDLRQVIRDVVDLVSPVAAHKGVRLRCDLGDDLPAILRGDPNRIRQILTNFAGNAVKFTPRGEVTMIAGLLTETAATATVRLSVKDSGIGIPLDRQEAIFESYQQADSSSARDYGGTGLGLAICKQLTRLMEGRIGVVSHPGLGSEFWVELPLGRAASAPRRGGSRPGPARERGLGDGDAASAQVGRTAPNGA
jgi:two-component system, sensor histidine kinase and response regulator